MIKGGASFGLVVHATDFTQATTPAFYHALKLALAAKGQLRLVHVQPDAALVGFEWTAFPGVRRTLAKWGLLDDAAPEAAVADQLGVRVAKDDIAAGATTRSLVHFVEETPTDILVLGSHRRKGLARILKPSISEPLVRRGHVPALLIPEDVQGFVDSNTGDVKLRNVLIAVDESPDPSESIRLAVSLAELLKADAIFHLLHVGAPIPPGQFIADPRVRLVNRQGPVAETILATAEDLDADLVVMATHGHDGVMDVLRGSTTEQVLRKLGRPILATPS